VSAILLTMSETGNPLRTRSSVSIVRVFSSRVGDHNCNDAPCTLLDGWRQCHDERDLGGTVAERGKSHGCVEPLGTGRPH